MRARLPDFHEVLQVYAVIAVMFAAWTITAFLWRLSALLLFLNLGEILTIFSYAMAANFLESLLILFVILAIYAVLPRALRQDFAARGTILAIGLVGVFMAFVGMEMWLGFERGAWLFAGPLVLVVLTLVLIHASSRHHKVRSLADSLSDRITVFLFVLLPLFAMSSIYVLIRNLA